VDATLRAAPVCLYGGRRIDAHDELPADGVIGSFEQITGVINRGCEMPVAYGEGWLRLAKAVAAA
jgi:hypothetical protein